MHLLALWRSSVLFLLALVVSLPLQAEQKQDFGDFEVHYNVINSTFLTPEVAKQYDITRSRSVGVVNIVVMKKNEDGSTKAINANVEGEVTNQVQQQNRLAFRRVSEGPSIYYLADFQFQENDPLTFTVQILADPNQAPLALRFSQTLFAD